ncbi:PIN-like domain-containing protein [Peribacillus frigoritolerans]|uniref:PIN-like domain-containing protein n=1 Tax=Peribacillus frigoritolerans TaxID=450367 RepID=UPI0020C03EFB|nr:PIN-like domain-containing protein [Peribacillus frigoritolerans]MEE3951646.1 PIN-like domain-containing protein [Peribacillus frigoritolerans]
MSYNYPFDKFKELWEASPLIIFDTNGFLNIYRYSTETIDQILTVLNSIPKEQFFVLSQVMEEYNKNRLSAISTEYSKYKEVTKEVERIMLIAKNDIDKQFLKYNKFKFPLVKELGLKINDAIEVITKEAQTYKENIKDEVKKNERVLKEDRVHLFIEELIQSESVGSPFTISTLLQIFAEGEERYKYKIPPGYMDAEKDKKDPTLREKFGDLILWKQLLEVAGSSEIPIIFITHDEKEDWWTLDKNKIPIRPRDELFVEFSEYSDQSLVFMSLTNFINHVSVLNNMVDNTTHIEMNASDICDQFLDTVGWDVTLDNDGQLTIYLIHSGDLQEFTNGPLSDVEIFEFSSPELDIGSVDINENQVIIETSFTTNVEISISESYSKNYSRNYPATVLISGSLSFEFEVDFGKIDDFIKEDTVEIIVGGFKVLECDLEEDDNAFEDGCSNCGNPNAPYHTKNHEPICERCSGNYESCPDCGKLFEEGTLRGDFCQECNLERVN